MFSFIVANVSIFRGRWVDSLDGFVDQERNTAPARISGKIRQGLRGQRKCRAAAERRRQQLERRSRRPRRPSGAGSGRCLVEDRGVFGAAADGVQELPAA